MKQSTTHHLLAIALLCSASACSPSAPPRTPGPKAEPVETTPQPAPRVVKLDDGSYVELGPGIESGFAHCCGNDQYKLEIECSDGLMRCYKKKRRRWKQAFGKHCKAALDQQCYEQTCARVCEAYWEVGPTQWQEITR